MPKGNPYKDKEGHWTTKENDGGECHHDGNGKVAFDDDYDEEFKAYDKPEVNNQGINPRKNEEKMFEYVENYFSDDDYKDKALAVIKWQGNWDIADTVRKDELLGDIDYDNLSDEEISDKYYEMIENKELNAKDEFERIINTMSDDAVGEFAKFYDLIEEENPFEPDNEGALNSTKKIEQHNTYGEKMSLNDEITNAAKKYEKAKGTDDENNYVDIIKGAVAKAVIGFKEDMNNNNLIESDKNTHYNKIIDTLKQLYEKYKNTDIGNIIQKALTRMVK